MIDASEADKLFDKLYKKKDEYEAKRKEREEK
jgi:hypothetical protein